MNHFPFFYRPTDCVCLCCKLIDYVTRERAVKEETHIIGMKSYSAVTVHYSHSLPSADTRKVRV
jgi:hypothetical protein